MNLDIKANRLSERGATMLEFAMVAGVFFMLIMGIVDFSRYMSAKSLLKKATQSAVRQAASIDSLNVSLSSNVTTQDQLDQFVFSSKIIEDNAYRITDGLTLRSGPGNGFRDGADDYRTRILPYRTGGANSRIVHLAIIMPGEEFSWAHPESGALLAEVSTHPTYTNCTSQCDDQYEKLLIEHPIVAEMRGKVNTLLPFLGGDGSLDITVRSFAYRELPAKSSDIPPANPPNGSCPLDVSTCPAGADLNLCSCLIGPGGSPGGGDAGGEQGGDEGTNPGDGTDPGDDGGDGDASNPPGPCTPVEVCPPGRAPNGCSCVHVLGG